ncbi:MAG: hypothetical protein F4Y02_06245 [Chloroflexi bacterium]|nr:hypothetical protein [Chloroflexota bacterium]
MFPFNALAVTVTSTHADPLGPAVIEIGAAGARVDPRSIRPPNLDLVFETRVNPGRPLPTITTNWFGIGPEDVHDQPKLQAAVELLEAKADRLAPDVLAATHPPDLVAAVPDLAHRLLPGNPSWLSTFRLSYHVWPFHSDCMEPAASPEADREIRARNLDPHLPASGAIRCLLLLARQACALFKAGHTITPGTLQAWSAAVPLLATVPVASRRYRGLPWRMVPRRFCETIAEQHRTGGARAFPPALEPMAVATAAAALRGEYAVALADVRPPAGAV